MSRLSSLFILLVLLALPVAGRAAQPATEALINCVVAGADASHPAVMAATYRALSGDVYFGFYFEGKAGAPWQKGPQYRGKAAAILRRGDQIIVLGPEVSEAYDAKGVWKESLVWMLPWEPLAAAAVGPDFFAFGAASAADGTLGPIRVAALVDGKWVDSPNLVLNRAPILTNQICTVAAEKGGTESIQVLWLTSSRDRPGVTVHRERFSGTGWEYLPGLALPGKTMRIAAARDGQALQLFALDLAHSIGAEHPLLLAHIKAGDDAAARAGMLKTPLAALPGLDDELFARTHSLAAYAANDKTVLLLVGEGGADLATLTADGMSARTNVLSLGWLQRMETILLGGLLAAAYLLLLGFSLWRSRKWPRKIEIEGNQIELASWKQRVGAFTVDMAALLGGVTLLTLLFDADVNMMERFSSFAFGSQSIWLSLLWALYFVLMESHGGQTIGKRLFGIAVVTQDLHPLLLHHVLMRNLFRLIEPAVVSLIVVLNLRTSQRIGDFIAGTLVVKVPRTRTGRPEPLEEP